MPPISDEARQAILAALLAGTSISKTAQLYKVSKSTVSKLARHAGMNPERSRTQKATEAHVAYAQQARLDLSNKFFRKLEDMLSNATETGEVKDLVMSFAILTDKRRLEEGEATERHEHSDLGEEIKRGREQFKLLRGRSGS